MNITFSDAPAVKSPQIETQAIYRNGVFIGEVKLSKSNAAVYRAHAGLHFPELEFSQHRLIQAHAETKEAAVIKAIHAALHECETTYKALLAIAAEMDIPDIERHPEELKP